MLPLHHAHPSSFLSNAAPYLAALYKKALPLPRDTVSFSPRLWCLTSTNRALLLPGDTLQDGDFQTYFSKTAPYLATLIRYELANSTRLVDDPWCACSAKNLQLPHHHLLHH